MTPPEQGGPESDETPRMKSALLVVAAPEMRLRLLRLLGRHGWSVDAVERIESALALLDQAPRDVAVIDWEIERGAETSLLTAMKSHPGWRSVPAILMHDRATWAELARARELGANDFLVCPFVSEAALRTFDRWVLDRAGPTPTKIENAGRNA